MGSATSNIVFYRSGNLDLKSAFKLFPITFIGSIIGAWTVHLMNRSIEAINADHAWCGRYLYDIQEGLGKYFHS